MRLRCKWTLMEKHWKFASPLFHQGHQGFFFYPPCTSLDRWFMNSFPHFPAGKHFRMKRRSSFQSFAEQNDGQVSAELKKPDTIVLGWPTALSSLLESPLQLSAIGTYKADEGLSCFHLTELLCCCVAPVMSFEQLKGMRKFIKTFVQCSRRCSLNRARYQSNYPQRVTQDKFLPSTQFIHRQRIRSNCINIYNISSQEGTFSLM